MDVDLPLLFLERVQRGNFSVDQHGGALNGCFLEVLIQSMSGVKDLVLVDVF